MCGKVSKANKLGEEGQNRQDGRIVGVSAYLYGNDGESAYILHDTVVERLR